MRVFKNKNSKKFIDLDIVDQSYVVYIGLVVKTQCKTQNQRRRCAIITITFLSHLRIK